MMADWADLHKGTSLGHPEDLPKKSVTTYKPAKRLRSGVSVCSAGYEDCPEGVDNHYHCGDCGGITGMFGHLVQRDGEWIMECPSRA